MTDPSGIFDVYYAYPRIARVVLTDKSQTKFFLMYSRKRKQWEFPGGKVEWGETYLKGATRELKEETGLTLVEARLLGTLRNSQVWHASRQAIRFMEHFFLGVSVTGFEINNATDGEMDSWGWYTRDEALELPRLSWKTSEVLKIFDTSKQEPFRLRFESNFE